VERHHQARKLSAVPQHFDFHSGNIRRSSRRLLRGLRYQQPLHFEVEVALRNHNRKDK
jgi:hypothetical protein